MCSISWRDLIEFVCVPLNRWRRSSYWAKMLWPWVHLRIWQLLLMGDSFLLYSFQYNKLTKTGPKTHALHKHEQAAHGFLGPAWSIHFAKWWKVIVPIIIVNQFLMLYNNLPKKDGIFLRRNHWSRSNNQQHNIFNESSININPSQLGILISANNA